MSRKIDPQLFAAHEHALQSSPCPQCGAALQLRHGKHGPFLGCTAYPECDYIKPLHQNDGHIIKELGVPCPECGHELVLRQGRYGMFIGCSHYPQCHHIESMDSLRKRKHRQISFARNAAKATLSNANLASVNCFMRVMRILSVSLL